MEKKDYKEYKEYKEVRKKFEEKFKKFEKECGILRNLLALAHFDSTVKYERNIDPCVFYYPRWIIFNNLINQLENYYSDYINPDDTVLDFEFNYVSSTYKELMQILDEELNGEKIELPPLYDINRDYDRVNSYRLMDVEMQMPSYYNTTQIKDILIRCCSDNHNIFAKFMMSEVPHNLKKVVLEDDMFKGSCRWVKLDTYLSYCHGIYSDKTIIDRYHQFIDDYISFYDYEDTAKYNLFLNLADSRCDTIHELMKAGFYFPNYIYKLKVTNTQYMFNKQYDDSSVDAINYIYEKINKTNPQYIIDDIKYFLIHSSDTEKIFKLHFEMNDELFALLVAHIYHVIGKMISPYQKSVDEYPESINSICGEITYYRDKIVFEGIKKHISDLASLDRYINQLTSIFDYIDNNIDKIIHGEKPLFEDPDDGQKLQQKPNK